MNGRTTASHNIIAEAGKLNSKKNKEKGLKEKRKETTAPESDDSIEDDSHERDEALSSPIKGKTSRELTKVIY